MSSVVISGDTSGSVTLQAPAVAGTTVLTLPATSGTVVTTATSTGISGSAITTGTVGVSVGGTGANTLTANNVILGNGTSAVQFVAPGSTGNVLTSNGTTWTSAAAGGGALQTQIFSSPGTWTKPSSCTQVRVTVIGGGGTPNTASPAANAQGGSGGIVVAIAPVTGPVSVTVGSGVNSGAPGSTGGTSSFGPAATATGGAVNNSNGSGSSTGTVLFSGNINTASSTGAISFGNIIGSVAKFAAAPASAYVYSVSGGYMAGLGALYVPGQGTSGASVGGAVLVEFVG